jgi:hypothetical protein
VAPSRQIANPLVDETAIELLALNSLPKGIDLTIVWAYRLESAENHHLQLFCWLPSNWS